MSFALASDSYGVYAGELLDLLQQNGEELLAKAQALARAQGLPVDTVLYENLQKTVQQRVVDEAIDWRADVIVIGTHGRRGVRRMMLGSSAEGVARTSPVPVLLVRAPDTAT